jgi:hypothetical protein
MRASLIFDEQKLNELNRWLRIVVEQRTGLSTEPGALSVAEPHWYTSNDLLEALRLFRLNDLDL